jgi:hypothetical protein
MRCMSLQLQILGPDSEPVIYTNAAHIKLDIYRLLIEKPQ